MERAEVPRVVDREELPQKNATHTHTHIYYYAARPIVGAVRDDAKPQPPDMIKTTNTTTAGWTNRLQVGVTDHHAEDGEGVEAEAEDHADVADGHEALDERGDDDAELRQALTVSESSLRRDDSDSYHSMMTCGRLLTSLSTRSSRSSRSSVSIEPSAGMHEPTTTARSN